MYSKICVIGLGTVGSFIAKKLSELETTKSLMLIDYDIVKRENIKTSIYSEEDIGKPKTQAILKKINSNKLIQYRNEKFIEGSTKLKKYDLVIDCRDFTYERKNIIDSRLYISFRHLVIDCRKNVKYTKQHEGKYLAKFNKIELDKALSCTINLIKSGDFDYLLKNQIVQEIPIDYLLTEEKNLVNKYEDIIYDENSLKCQLINFMKNYSQIIDINKNNDLTICIGSKGSQFVQKNILKNSYNSLDDISISFSSIIRTLPFSYNYYLVSLNYYNGRYYVELLPETGSA